MPARNALVIAVDGLRASALGAYGNTWYETPALDALASQSRVVDWMWCDSPSLPGFYRGAWHGLPNGGGSSESAKYGDLTPSLAQRLAQAGVVATLTTDDLELADAADFAEICRVETQASQSAATIVDTTLAQLFAVAAEQLPSSAPRLLWLHARGFHGPWDAPLAVRAELLDDDDPPPPQFVAPPALVTPADQDEALLYRAAYAAQAMTLDDCVGGLLAALADLPRDRDTLVVLVGVRGYALGEHGSVGGDCAGLYSELLHVPCLLRLPQNESPPGRLLMLAQPVDLFATLLSWFDIDGPSAVRQACDLLACEDAGTPPAKRHYATARGRNGEAALRTAAWMVRRPPTGDDALSPADVELYVKPDDRWEANEIAARCPDVAERLASILDHSDDPAAPIAVDLVIPPR